MSTKRLLKPKDIIEVFLFYFQQLLTKNSWLSHSIQQQIHDIDNWIASQQQKIWHANKIITKHCNAIYNQTQKHTTNIKQDTCEVNNRSYKSFETKMADINLPTQNNIKSLVTLHPIQMLMNFHYQNLPQKSIY